MQENVTKIVIEAYTDAEMKSRAGSFTIPVNPEQYAEKRQLKYDTKKGIGNQGTNSKYGVTEPEELKLEFIFDNTGAVEGNRLQGTAVREQVNQFLNTVYTMEGKIHKPKFLLLQWGKDLTFPCVLTSLDINYVLFARNGSPLRAKVNATFLNFVEEKKRIALEDKSSPDLTHVRIAAPGDRLDWLTYQIYGESQHVLQVAKENRLTTIRRLETGSQIVFPPFDKQEN